MNDTGNMCGFISDRGLVLVLLFYRNEFLLPLGNPSNSFQEKNNKSKIFENVPNICFGIYPGEGG